MRYGKLALEAGYRLPLKVLRSAAGFYIGTYIDDGGPVSRESVEYYSSEVTATFALERNLWTQRPNP